MLASTGILFNLVSLKLHVHCTVRTDWLNDNQITTMPKYGLDQLYVYYSNTCISKDSTYIPTVLNDSHLIILINYFGTPCILYLKSQYLENLFPNFYQSLCSFYIQHYFPKQFVRVFSRPTLNCSCEKSIRIRYKL